jgi:acyl-coenzyme A thioesterase PaaI-like protein
MHLFDNDIALTETGDSRFTGKVSGNWSVNGNPNGGYLMAMIAGAMLAGSDKRGTPVVTANYMARCAPGPAEIAVSETVRSGQFTRFEGRLSQDGRERIRALGTFAAETNECAVERYETGAPELAPFDDCVPVPHLPKYTLFENLELRLDPSCAGWLTGELSEVSENRGYLRFRDDRPIDLLSLFLIIDSMPPAVFATQGITAWVPTIELSVNIRNLPRTKLLRCSLRTRFITCGLLEADGEVWGDDGSLAAISRQIAQFRKG